jgi:hypothetical protein
MRFRKRPLRTIVGALAKLRLARGAESRSHFGLPEYQHRGLWLPSRARGKVRRYDSAIQRSGTFLHRGNCLLLLFFGGSGGLRGPSARDRSVTPLRRLPHLAARIFSSPVLTDLTMFS